MFMTLQTTQSYKLNKNKTQITTSEFLTLALIDNNAYKQIENYRELNVRNCYSLLNHLNLVRQTVNEQFYRLKDLSGDDIILYSSSNHLSLPN